MSKKKPQHSKVQKQHELEQHEVKQVVDFFKKYGTPILVVLIVAIGAVGVINFISYQNGKKDAQAAAMLTAAKTPQQLEEVFNKYNNTPSAPIALLGLAQAQFNGGEYFSSRAQYESFLKDYGSHELAPIATYGIACCTEADGDFDKAAGMFEAFIDENPDYYLKPSATMELAYCLSQSNQKDKARIVLEDLIVDKEGSPWMQPAQLALDRLKNSL